MNIPKNIREKFYQEEVGMDGMARLIYSGPQYLNFELDGQITHSLYSDRMYEMDSKRYDELAVKHFGIPMQTFKGIDPKKIEAFVCDFVGSQVKLSIVEENVKPFSKLSVWRFDYLDPKCKKSYLGI